MGKRVAKNQSVDLTTAAKRATLQPRKTPYSHTLGKGVAMLLYVGATGHRWLYRTPQTRDKVLGQAAMVERTEHGTLPASADSGLTFEQARAKVFQMVEAGNETPQDTETKRLAEMTFGEAWDRYERLCRMDKTAAAMRTIRAYGNQIAPLAPLPASTTSIATLQDWADGLIGTRGPRGKPRTKASVNKVISAFKTALRSAHAEGDWQKLRPYKVSKVAKTARALFTMEQARDFVAEASRWNQSFGDYTRGLMLTGARPGELAQATVSDVQTNVVTGATELLIRFGKTRDKTGDRRVHLSPSAQTFFERMAAGRAKGDVLFAPNLPASEDSDRQPGQWTSALYRRAVPGFAETVGSPGATLYALRHGYITNAIYKSVPLTSIARNCGTSVSMIEQTYSHALEDAEQSAFAAFDRAMDGTPTLAVVGAAR